MAEIEEVGVEAVVKGFEAFMVKLAAMNKAVAGTGVASIASKAALVGFGLALGAVALAATAVVAGVGLMIAGFFALSVASLTVARSVESAFAGVAKTTNGLTDEFGRMNEAGEAVLDQFRELSKEIPLSIEELLKIGEFAGQLGIAKESLSGFTEVVAALGVATDLTIEDAAIGLARLAGIYEISTEDMIENTERLGSAITFLGNNFKTNEPAILNFSKRLAGIAKPLGFSQAEVLGFGAAFTSAGVEAQLGGTAVQNAMIAIAKAVSEGGEELEAFASTSGKSVEEFSKQWESDAAGAFIDFIEGLGDAGEDAFGILDQVGLSSDRTVRALLPVAGAGDLLRKAIEGSTQAWEDNISLTREAAIRYATLDSQFQIFKNVIRDIGLEIGLFLLPAMQKLVEIITPIVEAIGAGLVPAFQSIFDALETHLLPALGRLFDAFGFDIDSASLTEGIANFGTTIAGGIEAFADFVDEVAELVDLYREGGIDSVAEHFGIAQKDVDLFLDIGSAILITAGAFVALKSALVAGAFIAGVIGTIVFWFGELSAAIALVASGQGVLATLGAIFAGVSVSASALILPIAALIGVIAVFGERALESLKQLVIIGVVLIGQFIGNVVTAITSMWESIKTNTATATETFKQKLDIWGDDVRNSVNGWVLDVRESIANMWLSIKENTSVSVSEFLVKLEEWRAGVVEKMVEFGVEAIQVHIDWWRNMITTLNEKGAEWGVAIGTWVVDMVTKLREGVAKWVEVGKAMMDGLLEGLKRNVGQIILFITQLAKQVLDTILAVFGVKSPSRVFEDIGKQLMKGLALGIDANANLPQVALDAAGTSLIAAESQAMNGSTVSGNVDNSTSFNVSANYAETQSPNTIADDLALAAMLAGAS